MRRVAAILAVLSLTGMASAKGWQGFYTPTPRAGAGGYEVAEGAVCLREILRAQLRYNIPDNLLLAIGLQEAGVNRDGVLTVWPWSVNAEGTGRVFASRDSAMTWVLSQQGAGVKSIDVGCMQVNLMWHPDAFDALDEGFDPARNVDYAARFLRSLYDQHGDWELAAGSYHSNTPERRDIYLASLTRNMAVANARIDDFRGIAGQARPRDGGPVGDVEVTSGGIGWSADLSREASGGARSLYSDQELQPVLPVFLTGGN